MGTSIVAAMVLMSVAGLGAALAPVVMVSAVVLASATAAWRYLERYSAGVAARRAASERATLTQ